MIAHRYYRSPCVQTFVVGTYVTDVVDGATPLVRSNARLKHANYRRAATVNGQGYRFIQRLLKFVMLNQHQAITRRRS